jgi:photosystem II stability/assembly factor-like uncharacterized protein
MIASVPLAGSFAPFKTTGTRGVMLLVLGLLLVPVLRAAESSESARLAAKSLLLDIARAGSRLVAVGDRGHVLLSDDEGRTWRQVIVPTRAMLTGVCFGDSQHGWAVGHDGALLATTDAGETWKHQYAGVGVDVIFLDVFFSDAQHGLVVGAYGKCLLTTDGGQTWEDAAPVPDEMHINQITPTTTDLLYLAGEAGTLLSSTDAHKPWHKHDVPYDGSLFGVLPLGEHSLLTYGLRGHVLVSDDDGESWTERDMPAAVLIMAGIKLKSGVVILAGAGGNFFVSRTGAKSFAHWKPSDYLGGVSALLETADGALLAVGESGTARLQLPLK